MEGWRKGGREERREGKGDRRLEGGWEGGTREKGKEG